MTFKTSCLYSVQRWLSHKDLFGTESSLNHVVSIFRQKSQRPSISLLFIINSCCSSSPPPAGAASPGWRASRRLGLCSHTRPGPSTDFIPRCFRCCHGQMPLVCSVWRDHQLMQLALFIVWNVLILLWIFKVGNISPPPTLFVIALPAPLLMFSCLLLEFLSTPFSASSLTVFPSFLILFTETPISPFPSLSALQKERKGTNRHY